MSDSGTRWIVPEASRRAKSAIAVALSLIILVGGFGFVGYKGYAFYMDWRQQDDYIGDGDVPVEVVVNWGDGWARVGDALVALDVIKDPILFEREALRIADGPNVGTWSLFTHLPAKTAAEMLNDEDNRVIWRLTIREGLRLTDMIPLFIEELGISEEEMDEVIAGVLEDPTIIGLSPWAAKMGKNPSEMPIPDLNKLDGFLFPDTYLLSPPIDTDALSVLTILADWFNDITKALDFEAKATALGLTPQQAVVVASIIEMEVFSEEYRPQVARVVLNRLKEGMPLQLDSTVNYGLNRSGHANLEAGNQDTDTPYNTYMHSGLPPTPIGNPGRAALQAAVNPVDGNWLYFVTINLVTGETKFSATWEEHLSWVSVYQQWCRDNPEECPE